MKRSFLSGLLPLALLTAACEDGPNQVYAPSPGAGSYWNDGQSASSSTTATQGYGSTGNSGANRNEICNAEKKHAIWSNMVKQPIHPLGIGGGLDIAGGPKGDGVPDPTGNLANESWSGLTLDQAETINCQSTFEQDAYGDGSILIAGWGDNGEVSVWYRTSNRQILTVSATQGYLGTLDATSRDNAHKFSIPVGTQVRRDGQPYNLDWKDPTKFGPEVNELYDAIAGTYTANASETDCIASGHCIVGDFGDLGAYIWFTAVGTTLNFATTNATQPVPSTPIELDQDKTKVLGFSDADVFLKNDDLGEGPTATRLNVFGTGKDCVFKMGMLFSDFRDNCVAPASDAQKNAIEMAKLYGSMGHSDERYRFDIVGVDPNFSATLADDAVVQDADRPKDNDYSSSISIDQQSLGRIRNDYVNNDVTQAQDWHGLGWLTLEWANLAQKELKALNPGKYKFDLGAPECLSATPAAGCTGLEGIVTTAPRNARGLANDPNALGPTAITNPDPASDAPKFKELKIGMKPSRWYSFFCSDAGGITGGNLAGYHNCVGANRDPAAPTAQYFFDTAYSQMVKVAGNGLVQNLPTEARDIRFLFKQWIFALVKYLAVADKPALTLAMIDAQPIDGNNLFFDAIGSGQFEFAEYVDRHNVNKGQDPLDVTITVDVLHGIINDYSFVRELFRGEEMAYSVMRENEADHLGAENNALLTNMFGSPVLASAYPTYECATNTDPANPNCGGAVAPMDSTGFIRNEDGSLLLAPYKGAWGQTEFRIGQITDMSITKTYPLIQSAMVTAPNHADPYDLTSATEAPITKLIPWYPKGAGIGFPVAVNGSQDKWITTYQLDFSGETVSANIDYDMATDANGNQGMKILAVETTDFLGDVFVCQDPGTGDILRARMYTSAATIVDWFAGHPGTEQTCSIIYRYSAFGNYLDYITSLTNGVRLAINPGAGGGRVVDVTLFDPSVVGQ